MEFKYLKEQILEGMDNNALCHGYATTKNDIPNVDGSIYINRGEEGMITAYLPEDNTFAVWFIGKRWVTFKMSEQEFNDKFIAKITQHKLL